MDLRGTTLFFVLACCLTMSKASVVSFNASPDTLKSNISDALSMLCAISENGNNDVKRTSSIFVTKTNGTDVASITTFTAPQALTDSGNLAVKGSLSATSGDGELQLSWNDPSLVELGSYFCMVTAVDAKGHTVLLTSSLTLTSAPPAINDVIEFFNKKLLSQQQTIEKLTQDSSKQTSLEDRIAKLEACASTHVAFNAEISRSRFRGELLDLQDKQTVVWDRVTLNEGGNYNGSTGEFRCAVPGVYVFHVHVYSYPNKYAFLQLEKNGEELVDLAKDSYDHDAEATLTRTVSLAAGDVVRVTEDYSGISTLFQQSDHSSRSRINYFTGHLIYATNCNV